MAQLTSAEGSVSFERFVVIIIIGIEMKRIAAVSCAGTGRDRILSFAAERGSTQTKRSSMLEVSSRGGWMHLGPGAQVYTQDAKGWNQPG